MGATSSSPSSVTPILPANVSALTAADVASEVRSLGKPYEGYAGKIEENGLDGSFLEELTADDLPGIFTDIGVQSTMHQKKLSAVFKALKSTSTDLQQRSHDESAAKKFAGFLSHFKHECGTEARLVQVQLKPILQRDPLAAGTSDVFLDSDDLSDLRNLLNHVKQSEVLVILQSKGVLTRPWVIAELYTAVTNAVPIVALNVRNSYSYNYAEALDFLMFFDQEIEIANAGAAQLLVDMGIDPEDVAYRLSDCLPNIVSTDFNPNASEKVIQASLEDLVDSMRKAVPIDPSVTKEEWLEKRKAFKPSSSARKPHGASEGAADVKSAATGGATLPSKALADVPRTVPELPSAYLVRSEDLSQLKAALLEKRDSKKRQNKVGAHGMVSVEYPKGIMSSWVG